MTATDLSQLSMHELFRAEAESQAQLLTASLLALERNPTAAEHLEACMRAAHSLKGAARIVDIGAGVTLAHAMEDLFVTAQQGRIVLNQEQIDRLLQGVDLMIALSKAPDTLPGQPLDLFVADLRRILRRADSEALAEPEAAPDPAPAMPPQSQEPAPAVLVEAREDRVLRVTVDNLNRLLGLAGESLVESRWLKPFGQSLLRLKRLHHEAAKAIDSLRDALPPHVLDERAQAAVTEAQRRVLACQQYLADRLTELEASDRKSTNLAHRLYDQTLACRMRPLADGIVGLPRMVRDVSRSLGKQVRLEVVGAATKIDRDILEKLEAPLGHLLRNAVDHGIEMPDERRAAGKAAEGIVRLEATHSAAALQIVVADDGRGIDVGKLRETVVKRGLAKAEIASKLSESELLEFLFLPAFTMRSEVTEISGRGVGLDVVQDMIRQVRGLVHISSQLGRGTRFQLQLPLTLSVVRTLLAEIGGEPYAFPLAHVVRAVKIPSAQVEVLQGRQHFNFDGQQVGLVSARQILGGGDRELIGNELPIVVIGDQHNRYGLVVDRFLGGRELVVQPLDPRLGKIKDISAGALMADGSPVLIVDVEDMLRSMEKLARSDRLNKVERDAGNAGEKPRKRVLVVDDSLTVRELERKLLDRHGYDVEVAVDGMDGWNALRSGHFDLLVTDIDMPRMDGIELVGLMKKDANLKSLPAMIVSYKDRDEDRRRGLEAGADYYLSKGSFHDDTLIEAVVDLIGEAAA
jgi:two-component system, chemotaxis family, sensor histidine kinase and response regulator WspE